KPGWGVAFRAVCFVARLANMQRLFDAARFAHPIPESRRRSPVEFFNTLLSGVNPKIKKARCVGGLLLWRRGVAAAEQI
ncbi:MAG TPA: hypothetical protein VHE58_04100, partial [Burkholderiales bacterium]|nr:hypothetical protein [Burkholderiales bacterium]